VTQGHLQLVDHGSAGQRTEAVEIVKMIDGLNRVRFTGTRTCWRLGDAPATSSAPVVRRPSRRVGGTAGEGAVKPAA
jgi:hypothetical protein